ncbi:MAG: aspartate carbamoyltransferase catalytic subunit [Planctomycetota bacterium]|nr:MAG: aspartate carbamoyltransferase catalytic subunit [Planctomycetota bacterium]
MGWRRRHLLGTRELAREEIECVLDTAADLMPFATGGRERRRDLEGRTVASLFFEPSTRTRTSFDLAARRLGATVAGFAVAHGSTVKGETTVDTARNIEAMGLDAIVVRSAHAGTPDLLARHLRASVINAGDGAREHPTQALLDLYTMRESFGQIAGLHVLIVGDIGASRVARSNLWALRRLGAEVTLCGPPTLVPRSFEALGARVVHRLDPELPHADVLMLLRIQHERHVVGAIPSVREYARLFGVNAERAARLPQHAVIMHPGPINRGVELTPEVADGTRSTVLRQTRNGVAVRMAVLKLCLEARAGG